MSKYKWEDEIELEDESESVFRLSASSVKTHNYCPYQFYLKKIVGLDETQIDAGHLELGSAVHNSIENVLNRTRWQAPPRPSNQLRQDMLSEFREINPDVDGDLWDKGIDGLETAAKYVSELREDVEVRALEKEFDFTLGRPDISAKFKGYIDFISESGEIWDWKTGKVREEGEIIQGAVYMRGYQELYDEPPEKINFVYLKEGKERTLKPSDENWQKMITHAKQLVQDIRRDEFTAEPDESKCYWCGVSGFCEAYANGAGGVDYEVFRDRGRVF